MHIQYFGKYLFSSSVWNLWFPKYCICNLEKLFGRKETFLTYLLYTYYIFIYFARSLLYGAQGTTQFLLKYCYFPYHSFLMNLRFSSTIITPTVVHTGRCSMRLLRTVVDTVFREAILPIL